MRDTEGIMALVKSRDPNEKAFHQAVAEVFDSIRPLLDFHPE